MEKTFSTHGCQPTLPSNRLRNDCAALSAADKAMRFELSDRAASSSVNQAPCHCSPLR
jgi:hypothetical protein